MGEQRSTEERVVEVIASDLGWKQIEVTREKFIGADLGADSLTIVDLTIKLEDEFDIDIPDEDMTEITTVGQVIDYVRAKLARTFLTSL
jgi:acyl carrier protein